jgi:hypothetical protein
VHSIAPHSRPFEGAGIPTPISVRVEAQTHTQWRICASQLACNVSRTCLLPKKWKLTRVLGLIPFLGFHHVLMVLIAVAIILLCTSQMDAVCLSTVTNNSQHYYWQDAPPHHHSSLASSSSHYGTKSTLPPIPPNKSTPALRLPSQTLSAMPSSACASDTSVSASTETAAVTFVPTTPLPLSTTYQSIKTRSTLCGLRRHSRTPSYSPTF